MFYFSLSLLFITDDDFLDPAIARRPVFAEPSRVRFVEVEDNLDQQVDGVQQDRPELRQIPGPMGGGNGALVGQRQDAQGDREGEREELADENEDDDEADGRIKLYHAQAPSLSRRTNRVQSNGGGSIGGLGGIDPLSLSSLHQHIDHDLDEDDNDMVADDQEYRGLHHQVNPLSDLGINQVNYEPNQLMRRYLEPAGKVRYMAQHGGFQGDIAYRRGEI